MMMLSWDERGTLVPFSSTEELDRLLDGLADEVTQADVPVMVTVLDSEDVDAPALSIACGGPLSVAVWRTPEETVAMLSQGDQEGEAHAKFSFCGESVTYPASALIASAEARAAVRAFVSSGARPEDVRWQHP